MERRKILKSSLAVLGTTALVSLGYPVTRFVIPPTEKNNDERVTIDKKEIPPGAAKEVTFQGTPIIIINRKESGFIALSRVCGHLGCLVGYDKFQNKLVCPCHAGAFNLEGQVISGPPSNPLNRYDIQLTSQHIILG
jgi:cytochrome b6-f complex iron-sulfur subunit